MSSGPLSSPMLLLYYNTFLTMTQFVIVQPTAGQYLRLLNTSPRLGGAAIAAAQFGSALFQIPIYFMLRYLPFKIAFVFLLLCEFIGSILYAVALPSEQVAILFIGRAISSFSAGQQIYLSGLQQADLSSENRKAATQINTVIYQVSAVISLFIAAFVLSAAPITSPPTVNAATIPGFIAAFFIACLMVFTMLSQRTTKPKRFQIRQGGIRVCRAIVGVYVIFVCTFMEGLRQNTLFELYYERWQFEWTVSGPETVTMIAAFIFLGSALSYLYDRSLAMKKWRMVVFMSALASTMLPLAPWKCDTTASVLLQSIFGVLYAILVRIMFGYASLLVIETATFSRHVRLYYLAVAICTSVGLGIGATLSTVVDLSVVPFLVVFVLGLVGASLLAYV